jgi:hypothetical protein
LFALKGEVEMEDIQKTLQEIKGAIEEEIDQLRRQKAELEKTIVRNYLTNQLLFSKPPFNTGMQNFDIVMYETNQKFLTFSKDLIHLEFLHNGIIDIIENITTGKLSEVDLVQGLSYYFSDRLPRPNII